METNVGSFSQEPFTDFDFSGFVFKIDQEPVFASTVSAVVVRAPGVVRGGMSAPGHALG